MEEKLVELLSECRKLLSDDALLVIVTLYNLEASPLMIGNLMGEVLAPQGGSLAVGELALSHSKSPKKLPLSLYGRWSA